jgi:hypothetical protein
VDHSPSLTHEECYLILSGAGDDSFHTLPGFPPTHCILRREAV